MQPKVILSPAWAAQAEMVDTDLTSLFDIDLTRVVAASTDNTCPRCGNPPNDSKVQLFTSDSATATPEKVSGHVLVRCFCETVYAYAYVHELDAQHPLGQAHVRAASAAPTPQPSAVPQPVVPPLPAWAPIYDVPSRSRRNPMYNPRDVVMGNYQRRNWYPFFDQENKSAAVIWNEVEKERRRQQNEEKG